MENQNKSLSFKFIFLSAIVSLGSLQAVETTRVIQIQTKKIDNAVHWVTEPGDKTTFDVTQGEKVHFVVTLKEPGGFPIHGFSIPALNITKQVDRTKPLELDVTIPTTLAAKDYEVGCQLHQPGHKPATMTVKPATGNKT